MDHELPTEFLQVKKEEVYHVVDDQKRESFRVLQQLFESGQLCDVEIRAGSRSWRCHRVVLAATSAYFRTMFTTNMAESTQDAVAIRDIGDEAMDALITFAYTTSIKITTETVQSLLYAASFLQIESAAKACDDFMREHLHPSNCIQVQCLAEQHCRAELMQAAEDYVMDHFTEVVTTEEFLKIPVELLEKYMNSDYINVGNENQVYEAVMLWLKHDIEDRCQWLGHLLSLVRLPLMSMSYLMETVEREELVRQSPQCRDFLDEAKNYQMTQVNLVQTDVASIAPHKTCPRKSYRGMLFAVGGYAGNCKCLKTVECFDVHKDRWFYVADMHTGRALPGVCFANGLLYAVGGAVGSKPSKTGEVFNPKTNKWTRIAPMLTYRGALGVASLEGQVYAVGGFNDLIIWDTVERYNPDTNVWTFAASMLTPRAGMGLAVYKGRLYAMGGGNGLASNTMNICECYEPLLDKWTAIASMNQPRRNASCSTLNDFIYIAGGNNKCGIELYSVERYDPMVNQWTLVSSMESCRGKMELATLGKQLYAACGQSELLLNYMETYNPDKDCWEAVRPMQKFRTGMGLASCSNVSPRLLLGGVATNRPQRV